MEQLKSNLEIQEPFQNYHYYPLANEVAKGYTVVTLPSVLPSFLPSFRNILVNTLGSTSFNGF